MQDREGKSKAKRDHKERTESMRNAEKPHLPSLVKAAFQEKPVIQERRQFRTPPLGRMGVESGEQHHLRTLAVST